MKLLIFILFIGICSRTSANIHFVSNLNDSGAGSLRETVSNVSAGDTIEFSVSGTITLTGGEIEIDKDLVLLSNGSANLTLSGNSSNRVFTITAGKVIINSITFENGVKVGSGGAIYNSSNDSVIFNKCVFIYCSATENGGAILNSGAYLEIRYCTFSNNNANENGGALMNNSGNISISHSTFYGNTAQVSGAALSIQNGNCRLENTTISGNTANLQGGGIYGKFNAMNCTFTGNSAAHGGGASQSLSVFQNCIISGNQASVSGPDIEGPVLSNGHNLIGNTSGSSGFVSSDLIGINPRMEILTLNGGFTATHALFQNSPCIDAGLCRNAPGSDQRDLARTGFPDIGAYEAGGHPFPVYPSNTTLCSGESISFGNYTITTSGVYQALFKSAAGCDSTVELHVSQASTNHEFKTIEICPGQSILFGGQQLSTAGIYFEELLNTQGCDSIIELTLIVLQPDTDVSQNGAQLTAISSNARYQWINCATLHPIQGDTNRTFNAINTGEYAVVITENGCTDTSDCIMVILADIGEKEAAKNIFVYPGQTQRFFTIEFSQVQNSIEVRMVDMSGRTNFREKYSSKDKLTMDMTEVNPGLYLIHIETENSSGIFKIIRLN